MIILTTDTYISRADDYAFDYDAEIPEGRDARILYLKPELLRLRNQGMNPDKIWDHFAKKMGERFTSWCKESRNIYRWKRLVWGYEKWDPPEDQKRLPIVKRQNIWDVEQGVFNAGYIAQAEMICERLKFKKLTSNELLAVKRLENSLDGLDPIVQFVLAEEFASRMDVNKNTPDTADLEFLIGSRPWDGWNAQYLYHQFVFSSFTAFAQRVLKIKRFHRKPLFLSQLVIVGLHVIASLKVGEILLIPPLSHHDDMPYEEVKDVVEGRGGLPIHYTRAVAIMNEAYSGDKWNLVSSVGKILERDLRVLHEAVPDANAHWDYDVNWRILLENLGVDFAGIVKEQEDKHAR